MKQVFIRGEAGSFPNYTAALSAVGLTPLVSMDPGLAEGCRGLLLPGGADVDPALYGQENTTSRGIDGDRDRDEIALVHRFMAEGKPILGICRGEQVLNVALGGTLLQDIPGDAHHQNEETKVDRVHLVRSAHPLLESLYGESFWSNSSHHQAVDQPGRGLLPACYSLDGVVEGVVHENGRVMGVQFHPERMAFALRRTDAADGERIFRHFAGLL